MLFVAWPVRADDPIVGEIRIWSGTTPPDGWFFCDGRELAVADYQDLYDVFETDYNPSAPSGYFNIPDIRGRVVVMRDTSQSEFIVNGQTGGEKTHTLTIAEMPSHNHAYASNASGTPAWFNPTTWGPNANYKTGSTGGGGAHNNLQPYLVLNYIIFTGVYQNPTPTPTPTVTPTITPTPIPGGATGPLTGTITGSLVISQSLPSYAFTQTLTTGNEFVFLRSASYGEVIAGSGALLLLFGVIFWFVARSTRRSGD